MPSHEKYASRSTESTSVRGPPHLRPIHDPDHRRFPQAIAHRGFKARHPENTMGAFVGAVKAGAHAIETDLHLSRDGVVVLSHDATLKRCFGEDRKIIDCDWKYLSGLRTLAAPHEPMPRLKDLLRYLALPGAEHVWVLLDIKLLNSDDIAEDVMEAIARTIGEVLPSQQPWNERLVVGCWAVGALVDAKYVPLYQKYFPEYTWTHIGFSPTYARQFFRIPNMSFNILQLALMGPFGQAFIRDVKARNRPLFVWTVNRPEVMRWSIRKEVDGVITDDPEKFLEVCDNYDENVNLEGLWIRSWTTIVWFNLVEMTFALLWRCNLRPSTDKPWRHTIAKPQSQSLAED
ncbi:MAG: hypothetical protein M1837_003546 [Sclerophora amabilis]|nr:MAG: hypothetical protein M1837_003546 [Sclerophora amabilis]